MQMTPAVAVPSGACDDTVSHACYVSNSIFVTVCVYALALSAIFYVFWRFRWWPISRLRAREERLNAEVHAYLARKAAEDDTAEVGEGAAQAGNTGDD